ncbi:hypothetical protein [Singulisphaera sp. PoT]|uniref:hypothetical protein n=1 Tax=Singulisphaera sp. PoT TaxID=3411797 RepID=UPI003BF611B9
MANLTVTADAVAICHRPETAEIWRGVAAEVITPGQTVYQTSAGTWGVGAAGTNGKYQIRGIALNKAGAGQAVEILIKGFVSGFNLSSLAYDAQVFASDTAGALADAAGTHSVAMGRVVALSDVPSYSKVLYVHANWAAQIP